MTDSAYDLAVVDHGEVFLPMGRRARADMTAA
jgi:hypothetical protein